MSESLTFHLAEYKALRDEIVKRIELQNQIFPVLLVAFGTIITVGVQSQNGGLIILLYPIIALFLSFAWVSQTEAIQSAAIYIKEYIEIDNHSWENRYNIKDIVQNSIKFDVTTHGGRAGD
jgi:hypothetical protein